MMGRRAQDQERLFYSFNLEEAAPEDHRVGEIAAVLDLSWVYVDCGLCLCRPLGTGFVPRRTGQSGLSLVIRPSRGPAMNAFRIAISSVKSSSVSLQPALRRTWSVAKGLLWNQA